ncbi:hypothetical protein ACE6H2_011610 [Prunus campanulata]
MALIYHGPNQSPSPRRTSLWPACFPCLKIPTAYNQSKPQTTREQRFLSAPHRSQQISPPPLSPFIVLRIRLLENLRASTRRLSLHPAPYLQLNPQQRRDLRL